MRPSGPISVSLGNSSKTTSTTGGSWTSSAPVMRPSAPTPSWPRPTTAAAAAPTSKSPTIPARTRRRLELSQAPGHDLEQLDRVAAVVKRALRHHQREVLGRVAVEVERAADRLDRPVDRHSDVALRAGPAAGEVAGDLGGHDPAGSVYVREQPRVGQRGAHRRPGGGGRRLADQVLVGADAGEQRRDVARAELAQP